MSEQQHGCDRASLGWSGVPEFVSLSLIPHRFPCLLGFRVCVSKSVVWKIVLASIIVLKTIFTFVLGPRGVPGEAPGFGSVPARILVGLIYF